MPTMAQKPTISMDLFRDAAAAAFSEFGTSNGKKHEFFNKMPEMVAQSGKVMQWWEHRWIRAIRDVFFRDVWSFLLSQYSYQDRKKKKNENFLFDVAKRHTMVMVVVHLL